MSTAQVLTDQDRDALAAAVKLIEAWRDTFQVVYKAVYRDLTEGLPGPAADS